MSDLICVGLTTLDILAQPIDRLPDTQETILIENIVLAPAGTAGGTALIAATLGLDVAIAAQIGDDLNGRIISAEFERARIDTSYLATHPVMPTSTSILAIRSDGERPAFHQLGASIMTEFTPESVAAMKQARALHFAGLGFPNLSTPEAIAALAEIKASGTFITCDLISPQPGMEELLKAVLPSIDVFLPSEAELPILLGGAVSPEEALSAFVEMGAQSCIVKRGGEGSIGLIEGGLHAVAADKISVVDTTSCGDAYCAGIITGHLHGLSMKAAMNFATSVAGKVASGVGTLGALTHDYAANKLSGMNP